MNTRTDPSAPRVFIVRIYRNNSDGFAGQVQDAANGRLQVFSNVAELCAALLQRVEPSLDSPGNFIDNEEQS